MDYLYRFAGTQRALARWQVGLLTWLFLAAGSSVLPTFEKTRGAEPSTAPSRRTDTIRLIVDYSDGVEKHFNAIPYRDKMTILECLRAAAAHRHGINLNLRGDGSTAFLTEIDGLANSGLSGRNWVYRVNNTLGDQGIGKRTLQPGDTVLWKFDTYE